MSRVLVTGATGFVGRALCAALRGAGADVAGTTRNPGASVQGVALHQVADIGAETHWAGLLEGVDAVVHAAARVHVGGPAEAFHAVNAEGTRRLVQAAAAAGVRRLVYLSTVKVLGEATATRPFTDHDAPRPIGPYALSKWQGERFVAECAGATEWVVLRPPLVYGAGVGGNVARLLRLCRSGLPLPLGAIDNRRSLISLANLVDAIGACLGAPEAAGATFLVRDGEDVSTPQLVRRMAAALGRPARLFAVPPALLVAAGKIAGQSPAVARLVGNLAVDDGAIRRRLGWRPVQSMNDGLAETAARFAAGKGVGGP